MSLPHPDPTDEIALECTARVAALHQLPLDEVSPASRFDQLGLDSLDKTGLTCDLEEHFGVEIPAGRLHEIQTVGQMIDGLRELVAARESAKVAEPVHHRS